MRTTDTEIGKRGLKIARKSVIADSSTTTQVSVGHSTTAFTSHLSLASRSHGRDILAPTGSYYHLTARRTSAGKDIQTRTEQGGLISRTESIEHTCGPFELSLRRLAGPIMNHTCTPYGSAALHATTAGARVRRVQEWG